MKKKVIIIIIVLLTINTISWQLATDIKPVEAKLAVNQLSIVGIDWNQTYGGEGYEVASSLIQTSDGGFALAGQTDSYGAGNRDMWLVKTNATGQVDWNQTYGGTAAEDAFSLIQTVDGGFALAGYTVSYGAGNTDMWLVKTNATGQAEWNQTYGGIYPDIAQSVIQTADGGFVLAGYTMSYGAGNRDMWLVKTNATGQVEWNQTYGGEGYDRAYSVIQTADGGFALVGQTDSYGAGLPDMWLLVKTNATGQVEWNQTYGGEGYDIAQSVIQTADGGFALAGSTMSYGAGYDDMWLVRTNATGHADWNQTYGGEGYDRAYSVIQMADGGFALAGSTSSYGVDDGDMWLVKTNATGQVDWSQTYGGERHEVASSLIQTADGEFALAGRTYSYGAGLADMWLVKTISHTLTAPELLTPTGGVFTEEMIITWNPVINPSQYPVTYDLYYSNYKGYIWNVIVSDLSGTTYNWDISSLPNGSEYQVQLIARCLSLEIEVVSSLFSIENNINNSSSTTSSSTTSSSTQITPSWSFSLVIIIGIFFGYIQRRKLRKK